MEHGIKAKDGGLRCGEIKVHSLSCTKSMASVGKINIKKLILFMQHLQIAGISQRKSIILS